MGTYNMNLPWGDLTPRTGRLAPKRRAHLKLNEILLGVECYCTTPLTNIIGGGIKKF